MPPLLKKTKNNKNKTNNINKTNKIKNNNKKPTKKPNKQTNKQKLPLFDGVHQSKSWLQRSSTTSRTFAFLISASPVHFTSFSTVLCEKNPFLWTVILSASAFGSDTFDFFEEVGDMWLEKKKKCWWSVNLKKKKKIFFSPWHYCLVKFIYSFIYLFSKSSNSKWGVGNFLQILLLFYLLVYVDTSLWKCTNVEPRSTNAVCYCY